MTGKHYIERFRIPPNHRVHLKDFDPGYKGRDDKKDSLGKIEKLRGGPAPAGPGLDGTFRTRRGPGLPGRGPPCR